MSNSANWTFQANLPNASTSDDNGNVLLTFNKVEDNLVYAHGSHRGNAVGNTHIDYFVTLANRALEGDVVKISHGDSHTISEYKLNNIKDSNGKYAISLTPTNNDSETTNQGNLSNVNITFNSNFNDAQHAQVSNLFLMSPHEIHSIDSTTPFGSFYGTDNVPASEMTILPGTNMITLFEPSLPATDSQSKVQVPTEVADYKTANPDTKIYATFGSGQVGLTKDILTNLLNNEWQADIDGLVVEIETLGTLEDKKFNYTPINGGFDSITEFNTMIAALGRSLHQLDNAGGRKDLVITTGGSGLTAELAENLPGHTGAGFDPVKGQLDPSGGDYANLTNFLGDLANADFDYWAPQIYDSTMKESWYSWQAPGYAMWKNVPTEKIIPVVGQSFPTDTQATMQQDLKNWLGSTGMPEYLTELTDTAPLLGFPNTL